MSPLANDKGLWLVLDTAAPEAVVGVVDLDAGVVRSEVLLGETRRHAERLPDAVAEALQGRAVVGVGVGVGPGSFIGVRTGIAFSKGLCRAWGVPLVGVPSLWALASSFELPELPLLTEGGTVVAVLDARRGERYAQVFTRKGAALDAVGEPVAVAPSSVPAGDVVVGVDGAVGFVRAGPGAVGLLRVLRRSLPRADERASLAPLYVRAPDAKLPALDPARHRPTHITGEVP